MYLSPISRKVLGMPIAKFQVVQSRDTLLAADAVVNTVHLNHLGQDPDYDALCASVGGAFATWWGSRGGQLRVTAYGVEGPGPHDPLGTWMESSGSSPTSLSPREVALCLSYYAVMNKPRQRGRLFLPIGARDSSLGARPTDPQIAAAITLGQALSAVGGVNVDWVV